MKALVTACFLLLPGLAFATDAALPSLTVNIADPTPVEGWNIVTCNSGADCQTKINAATLGTWIQPTGCPYSININLPVPGAAVGRTANGNNDLYVMVKPAAFDTSVLPGYRATANTGMCTWTGATTVGTASDGGTPGTTRTRYAPVLTFSDAAHHWWVSGIEMVPPANGLMGAIVNISGSVPGGTSPAKQQHHIILDRVYLHGSVIPDALTITQVGVAVAAGSYIAVVNSTVDDILSVGGQDNQAILFGHGPGPFLIQNNVLGATSETILTETLPGTNVVSVLASLPGCDATIAVSGGVYTMTYCGGAPWSHDSVGSSIVIVDAAHIDGQGVHDLPVLSNHTVVTAISSDLVTMTLAGAPTNPDSSPFTPGFPFTGAILQNFDVPRSSGSYFPRNYTIRRNVIHKKAAWNIADPTFYRNTGADPGCTGMQIHATDNTKIVGPTALFGTNPASFPIWLFVTGGTGWTPGPIIATGLDGSNNVTTNRVLGTVGGTGGTCRLIPNVKNLLEFKGGWQVLIEQNIFINHWASGQTGAIVITPRWAAGMSATPCTDFTIRDNYFVDVPRIITFSTGASAGGLAAEGVILPPPYCEFDRLTIRNNLGENIRAYGTDPYYTNQKGGSSIVTEFGAQGCPSGGQGSLIAGLSSPTQTNDDLTIEHNTYAGLNFEAVYMFYISHGGCTLGKKMARMLLKNNVIYAGTQSWAGPIAGANVVFGNPGGTGTAALDVYSTNSGGESRSVTKNVIFDTALNCTTYFTAPDTGNACVTEANRSTVGFANYATGGLSGYLLTGGSYLGFATDGLNPGIANDFPTKLAGVLTGAPEAGGVGIGGTLRIGPGTLRLGVP